MTEVSWRQWKSYSGCLVRGAQPFDGISNPSNHMSRVVFLTAQLEAPTFGLVQSYDGAGMSGGLLHNIAVQPKDLAQGSLWALMRCILDVPEVRNSAVGGSFVLALAQKGWLIASDGVLRDTKGLPVSGGVIRDTLTPLHGKVPKSGPNWAAAVAWADLFHQVLSHPAGFAAQERYACAWLCAGNRADELRVYRYYSDTPTLDSPVGLWADSLPHWVHTAMSVYHSFSVNGPAPAATALRAAMARMTDDSTGLLFAKQLIRRLGKSTYGRWLDEPGDGTNRYDRTRKAVWKFPDLFPMGRDLMPKDL